MSLSNAQMDQLLRRLNLRQAQALAEVHSAPDELTAADRIGVAHGFAAARVELLRASAPAPVPIAVKEERTAPETPRARSPLR